MLRNRIVYTPDATGCSHDSLIPHTEIDYHVRKAAGGVGLVMTFGSASVDRRSDYPGLVRVNRPLGRA
jgi:2,4-dienoyl-CoA reductase-like NADH-dependent reductase (Old Yellow Enzyme family)